MGSLAYSLFSKACDVTTVVMIVTTISSADVVLFFRVAIKNGAVAAQGICGHGQQPWNRVGCGLQAMHNRVCYMCLLQPTVHGVLQSSQPNDLLAQG